MKITIFFLAILVFTSCKIREKTVYFQDSNSEIKIDKQSELTFCVGDIIAVDVTAMDMESVKPFLRENNSHVSAQLPSYNNGIAAVGGYLVDFDGYITLPVIGKIKVIGLNRIQLITEITNKLNDYILNPIVSVRLLNFKVTVLGDVRNPGTFYVPNERISLNEVLGLAGDLNITGVRDNILLIRDESGVKKKIRINLTNDSLFNSSAYYLKQNDVIYVEPNRSKRNSSLVGPTSNVLISITTLVIALVNLISK